MKTRLNSSNKSRRYRLPVPRDLIILIQECADSDGIYPQEWARRALIFALQEAGKNIAEPVKKPLDRAPTYRAGAQPSAAPEIREQLPQQGNSELADAPAAGADPAARLISDDKPAQSPEDIARRTAHLKRAAEREKNAKPRSF